MKRNEPHSDVESAWPRQFTLRAVLLAATVVPPLIGGFCGALGPYVQVWLWLAIGIPVLALSLLALTFALCYLLLVLPVLALAKAVDGLWDSVVGVHERRGG